jgi:hypothetical protein
MKRCLVIVGAHKADTARKSYIIEAASNADARRDGMSRYVQETGKPPLYVRSTTVVKGEQE